MTVEMTPKERENVEKYTQAQHAMQSGVNYLINHDEKQAGTSPKSLRVGVNTAMADHAALARLLIQKGIITGEEYSAALLESMQHEVVRYETLLSKLIGVPINLK